MNKTVLASLAIGAVFGGVVGVATTVAMRPNLDAESLSQMQGQTAALNRLVRDLNHIGVSTETLVAVVSNNLAAPRIAAEKWLGQDTKNPAEPNKGSQR